MYSSTGIPSSFGLENLKEVNGAEGDGDETGESPFWESPTENVFSNDSLLLINSNTTPGPELPIDMQFNAGNLMSIIVYSILFVFSAIGNLSVLIMLLRRRRNRPVFSPMDFMLLNLAIADLLVTFLMMPLEVAWSATVYWRGGDLLCRVMAFFRIFGLFLSSFVLVCLAVDRYMAVKYPMQVLAGVKRSRQMIAVSWILSVFCSSPQALFFQVEHHPVFTWYTQCVVWSSLPTKTHEFLYFLFGLFFMYLGPFIIMLFLYCGIVIELIKRHQECKRQMTNRSEGGLRRSGIGNLGKAREKALKMTVIIAVIFFICWTPYHIIGLWHFIDPDFFQQYSKFVKPLFFFACTNSTANPIVYGIFHLKSNQNRTATRADRSTMCGGFSRGSPSQCSQQQIHLQLVTLPKTEGSLQPPQDLTVFSNNLRTNVSVRTRREPRSTNGTNSNGLTAGSFV